ncbi:MAG: SpoIID/LytB domain-containing protein, partial [Prevotellaceae bacterium]|nr:SpoIID/LytB domain-containing protein [Prevotellaceae bacterium]
NILPVENYLKSVISSEMSATASLELLKAHAVISRSWLLANEECKMKNEEYPPASAHSSFFIPHSSFIKWYERDAHQNYDVCADDHCQRYQGITRITNPAALRAVEETRGEVLMADGEICDARFSKSCGGMTEKFENCWADVPHSYLTNVECPYCNTQDKHILAQVLNNYDQETPDFYRWQVTYSQAELSELIKQKSGTDFGNITDLIPVKRGASGRIVELQIVGEKHTATIGKELEIRKWLSQTHLYSSAFVPEKTADGFILHGTGWGHGVGLCQIGAAVMAEKGFSYREILAHYYKDTELTKRYL